jgi:hypothetical protein
MDSSLDAATLYLAALARAVEKRVVDCGVGCGCDDVSATATAPVAVLFSGGIDSTVLAALTHLCLPDLRIPIELINVAFGDDMRSLAETPDRLASRHALWELRRHIPNGMRREWRYVTVNVSSTEAAAARDAVLDTVFPGQTVMDYNIGSAIYFAARGVGSMHRLLPETATASCGGDASSAMRNSIHNHDDDSDDDGRMESGGGGLHKHLRVAGAPSRSSPCVSASSAGRLANLGSDPTTTSGGAKDPYAVLVDALLTEYVTSGNNEVMLATLGKEFGPALTPAWRALGYKKLGHYISDAVAAGVVRTAADAGPTSKTVSLVRAEDLARGNAMRGERATELQRHADSCVPYVCQSKVLILGMGADETLGGYVRYQRVFAHSGIERMREEMQRDFCRLWHRNLGRDDRCTGASGREGRFPFLDEGVLQVLRGIESFDDVCDVRAEAGGPGIGDKKLLRTCARMIGLRDVSRLQKRAIQFGSRVADRELPGSARIPARERERGPKIAGEG